MGTVWRLTIDIKPSFNGSYMLFREEAMEKLRKRFGLMSYVCTTIDRDLPFTGSIENVTKVYCESDFDGAYGLGEIVFDIFKEACDRWMKDGSKIIVSSWEDAGGELTYTKGEPND